MKPSSDKVETELKLRIDGEEAMRLRQSPWWQGLEYKGDSDLQSVYFDTPSRGLRKLGVSLRTRNKNDVMEQTLKMSVDGQSAVERHEWSSVIPDNIPDPALVIDPALPAPVRKLTAADLEAVFKVDVRREKRFLQCKNGAVEMVLDEGAVVNGKRRAQLREVELELKGGDFDLLLEEARRIVDIAGGRLHFRTKSDLGYAAAEKHAVLWSKAPAIHLDKDADVISAAQSILLHGLSHLTANDDCARSGAHIEGVHQCRVALRRMRSALRLFRDGLPVEPFAHLEKEIKWLAGALGVARDLDVLCEELIEPAAAAADSPEEVAPLLEAISKRRQAAHKDVATVLNSARYSRLLLDAFAATVNEEWREYERHKNKKRPPAARDYAIDALEKAHRRLLKRGKGFKKKSARERHALRIEIKKMRYATETLSPLFKSKQATQFLKGLAGLQDGLGALNDVVVAEGLLARLIRDAAADGGDHAALSYASGCVLGWHRHRAVKYNQRLYKEWRKFQDAKPFWR